jgi:hypothetical protein
MSNINNFDQSSTGINILLSCFFDLDMSNSNFKENIFKHPLFGFVYTNNEQVDLKQFDKPWLHFDIKDHKELLADFCNEFGYSDDDLTVLSERFELNDLEQVFSMMSQERCEETAFDFMKEQYEPLFTTQTVAGYSQGDQANVIIPQSYWTDVGVDKTSARIKAIAKDIHHFFYDAPLYCMLTVNNEEFDLMEYMDDPYDFDKDDFINVLEGKFEHEHKKQIIQFLRDKMPKTPEHP